MDTESRNEVGAGKGKAIASVAGLITSLPHNACVPCAVSTSMLFREMRLSDHSAIEVDSAPIADCDSESLAPRSL
jgi:hypothetical protein